MSALYILKKAEVFVNSGGYICAHCPWCKAENVLPFKALPMLSVKQSKRCRYCKWPFVVGINVEKGGINGL
jgi:hypothetical protein